MAAIQIVRRHHGKLWPAVTGLALGSLVAWLVTRDDEASDGAPAGGPDDELEDALLIEVIRSELDRECSAPGAVAVSCTDGVVCLEGRVAEPEVHRVVRAAARVPGVKEIHDRLRIERNPWNGWRRAGPAPDLRVFR